MTRSDSFVFLCRNGDLHRIELMWGLKFQIVSRPHIPVLLFWQVTETDRAKAGGDMRERHTHTQRLKMQHQYHLVTSKAVEPFDSMADRWPMGR